MDMNIFEDITEKEFKIRLKKTRQAWNNMIYRCHIKKHKDYGERGITVCEKWLFSFSAFLEDMGLKPDGLTLERKKVNGNYNKTNCCWATPKQQANNKRNSIKAPRHIHDFYRAIRYMANARKEQSK